jgi:glycosyltransferase involved in cell wall biosynthesis
MTNWAMDARSSLHRLQRLKRMIREVSPDLVHVHCEAGMPALVGAAASAARVTCILSSDAPEVGGKFCRLPGGRLYERYLTPFDDTRELLLKRFPQPDRVSGVRIGFDPLTYRPSWTVQNFRNVFAVSERAFTIGVQVDRLTRKSVRYLVMMLPVLTSIYVGSRLIILGEGPMVDYFKRNATMAGLGHTVRFVGAHADWSGFLGHLDLYLNLERDVRRSSYLLDAQAAGVPIAGFAILRGRALVAESMQRNLVEPQDYESFTKVIWRLIYQSKQRQELAQQGVRWVRDALSPEDMTTSYLDIYAEVLAGRPEPSASRFEAA